MPRRIGALRLLLLLALAAVAVRAAHLTLFDDRGALRGDRQRLTTLRLPPERGLILDRRGKELAVSVDAPSVYAVPAAMGDVRSVSHALARALGLDPAALAQKLESRERFAFVKRWVSAERARRVLELELPGVGVVEEPRRVYPYRELAGQVIGFTDIDGEGVRGIEKQADDWLRGEPGVYRVERDARGGLLAAAGVDPRKSAGGDVKLTLDAAFQADAESALDDAIERTGARGGIVISLDPSSGDVLALAERPGFDPNGFRHVPFPDTRARSFLDALEPGSTLKVFLVAGALDRGAVRPGERIDCEEGRFRVPGKTIRDTHRYAELDVGGVIEVSSNIGAAKIAYRLGPEAHAEILRGFGFGRSTGSGFPSESAGLLRPWKRWRPVDHASIAFGQALNVTPIQLAAAAGALANGGVWTRPRLVAARRRGEGRLEPQPPSPTRRVVSEEAARAVLSMMERVVGPLGTGRLAGLRGVRVAGKTGTAQILDRETGTYARDRYLAWFVGIAPADDPKLVVLVELDEPRRGYSGGAAAAPLFARVAADHLTRLGVATQPEPVPDETDTRIVDSETKPEAPEEQTAVAAAPAEKPQAPAPERPQEAVKVARSPSPAPSPASEPASGTGLDVASRRASEHSGEAARARSAPSPEPAARPAVVRRSEPAAAGTRERKMSLRGDGERVLLPDFEGLTVAEVVRRARGAFELEIRGEGRAIAQEPPPGTVLARSARVRVLFGPLGGGS